MVVNMVRDGKADAAVSAGNSGAFLAIGLVKLRTIPGIARPAIAAVFPGIRRSRRAARLGGQRGLPARVDGAVRHHGERLCARRARHRAIRASASSPSAKSGSRATRRRSRRPRLLDDAPVNFIGNVEGKDVFVNVADVVVTDGFVGNVMLKTFRGGGASSRGDAFATKFAAAGSSRRSGRSSCGRPAPRCGAHRLR